MKKLAKKQDGGSSKSASTRKSRQEASANLEKAMGRLNSMNKAITAKEKMNMKQDSTRRAKMDSIYKNNPEYSFRKKGGATKAKKK